MKIQNILRVLMTIVLLAVVGLAAPLYAQSTDPVEVSKAETNGVTIEKDKTAPAPANADGEKVKKIIEIEKGKKYKVYTEVKKDGKVKDVFIYEFSDGVLKNWVF